MRTYLFGGLLLLLLIGLSPGPALLAQQAIPEATPQPSPEPPETTPEAEAAAAEPAPACSDCHDVVTADFKRNPHSRGMVEDGNVSSGACEMCHEGATEHAQAGGDPTLVKVPRGREGADTTCLGCHDTATDRKTHRGGVHANSATVNCLSCHSIHHNEPRTAHLLAKPEVQLCGSCHTTYISEFRNKPYGHRMGRGGLACSSCHEAHGREGNKNLRLTRAGEAPCLECHTDKRGPFVFPHGGFELAGGPTTSECLTCHEPHGSNNPKQLRRARQFELCLECHSQIAVNQHLGSQPPAFHNISLPRYQNCTSCHVMVHGSNRSPALLK